MNDINLYAFNILKAAKVKLSDDYSYIVSNLIHLEHQVDVDKLAIESFADKLSEVFKNTNCKLGHDRICLVYVEPLSSKLKILSSYTSENIINNNMTVGYSCYVSPNSSLFQIKKTDIRLFSNISKIVETYNGNPQRSIKRLAGMGVRSGLTIPLGTFGFFSGFLFFNSVEEGAYNKINDQDFSVLSLLKLIASNLLYRHLQKNVAADTNVLNSIRLCDFGNNFDPLNFKNQLSSLFDNKFPLRNINIDIKDVKDANILYNPSSLVYLTIKILESYDSSNAVSKIKLSPSEDKKRMTLTLFNLKMPFEQLAYLNELGVFIAHQILVKGGNLEIIVEIEKSVDGKPYSVES